MATNFGAGDFLIRNVMGLDEDTGSLIVGEDLQEGQIVQFHLRDAQTASDDLDKQLRDGAEHLSNAQGALLFSCLGRG